MELIAELEKEKRGVYAGAVGYFGYDRYFVTFFLPFSCIRSCVEIRLGSQKDLSGLASRLKCLQSQQGYTEWHR